MSRKPVYLALVIILLIACGKSETPVQPQPTADNAPAPSAPETVQGNAVLIDGYIPAFPHKLRSFRTEGSGHFVVLEYVGGDRDTAISALSDSLREKGYKVAGPQAREMAVQYVFVHADGRRMSAIFSDPSSTPLVNPDAKGVAMFSWTDPPAD